MSLQSYFFNGYLEKDEKIMFVAHRHILIVKIETSKISLVGFIVPAVIWFLMPMLKIFMLMWMFIGLIKLLYELYGWYYDVWLITDRGVIDVKSSSLFDVSTTRVEYHMIEGVSYTISGFLKTIFNFGDLILEKIGSGTSVKLEDAADPKKVEGKILKYQEEYMGKKSYRDHKTLKHLLGDMIHSHVKEHGLPFDE